MADIAAAVAVALPLVKRFEGCRLTAYPDPESGDEPWTIGWGSITHGDGGGSNRAITTAPLKRSTTARSSPQANPLRR